MIVLPTPDLSVWKYRIEIEGADYLISARFYDRLNTWCMRVADTNDAAIISGRPFTRNIPLLSGVADSRRFPGDLIILSAATGPITRTAFNEGLKLYYLTAAEVALFSTTEDSETVTFEAVP